MIPLYAFLEGDTIGLLLLSYPQDTMKELKKKLFLMARTRVCDVDEQYEVWFDGKILNADDTVKKIGFTALDKIEVRKESAK